jgi:hypothetical protein
MTLGLKSFAYPSILRIICPCMETQHIKTCNQASVLKVKLGGRTGGQDDQCHLYNMLSFYARCEIYSQ